MSGIYRKRLSLFSKPQPKPFNSKKIFKTLLTKHNFINKKIKKGMCEENLSQLERDLKEITRQSKFY